MGGLANAEHVATLWVWFHTSWLNLNFPRLKLA